MTSYVCAAQLKMLQKTRVTQPPGLATRFWTLNHWRRPTSHASKRSEETRLFRNTWTPSAWRCDGPFKPSSRPLWCPDEGCTVISPAWKSSSLAETRQRGAAWVRPAEMVFIKDNVISLGSGKDRTNRTSGVTRAHAVTIGVSEQACAAPAPVKETKEMKEHGLKAVESYGSQLGLGLRLANRDTLGWSGGEYDVEMNLLARACKRERRRGSVITFEFELIWLVTCVIESQKPPKVLLWYLGLILVVHEQTTQRSRWRGKDESLARSETDQKENLFVYCTNRHAHT